MSCTASAKDSWSTNDNMGQTDRTDWVLEAAVLVPLGAWSGARVRQQGEEKEGLGTEGRALDFQAE